MIVSGVGKILILVIGTGKIGKAFSNYLRLGNSIINISSRSNSKELEKYFNLDSEPIDTIVWAGRDAGVPSDIANTSEFFYSLVSILEIMDWRGNFIYMSSAGVVYGESNGKPWQETDSTNPVSLYGILKVKHEKLLLTASKQRNFSLLILRVTNVYELNLTDTGIVGEILRALSNDKNLFICGGWQTRDFIEINDLCKILLGLIEIKAEGVFNIGTGHSISINNLVNLFENKLSKKARIYQSDLGNEIIRSVVSIRKLLINLGWVPDNIEKKIAHYNLH